MQTASNRNSVRVLGSNLLHRIVIMSLGYHTVTRVIATKIGDGNGNPGAAVYNLRTPILGHCVAFDTVTLLIEEQHRYIFTAIDHASRLAFALAVPTHRTKANRKVQYVVAWYTTLASLDSPARLAGH